MSRKQPISLGALRINAKVDRLDQLEDGRLVILDYKTGEIKTAGWQGDRPDEPQLMIYAAHHRDSIVGVAFAQIRAGKIGLHGIAADAGVLPGMKNMANKGAVFADQIAGWPQTLARLAGQFVAGNASVNPKLRQTCEYCAVTALCRVRDLCSE